MATRKIYIGNRRKVDGYECIFFERDNIETALKLNFKNCAIDEVIVENVLEFIPADKITDAIVEWRRVIKVGGKFFIVYPDVVRASLFYQKNVLSFKQLQEFFKLKYRTFLTFNKVESLLLLRYPYVNEEFLFPINKKKKLWNIVLSATKGKLE